MRHREAARNDGRNAAHNDARYASRIASRIAVRYTPRYAARRKSEKRYDLVSRYFHLRFMFDCIISAATKPGRKPGWTEEIMLQALTAVK